MHNTNYDSIAKDYHLKRKKPWISLKIFLKTLDKNGFEFSGYSIDLGCANGRNFKLFLRDNIRLIGIDNSLELLKIAHNEMKELEVFSREQLKSIQLILSDISYLPIRSNIIKNIFSIATLHHIKNKLERRKSIKQLYNILTSDGYIILSLWRKYQKRFKRYFITDWFKRKFNPKYNKKQKILGLNDFGDKFVPWKISKSNIAYNRFYHFFSNNEIKKLLNQFKVITIKKLGGPNNKDNFFILAKKD